MANAEVAVGQVAYATFVVYDDFNTPITGLLASAFTTLLSNDGAVSALPVTIIETGDGRYTAYFTMMAGGEWFLVVRNETYKPTGWAFEFMATGASAGSGGGYKYERALPMDWRNRLLQAENNERAAVLLATLEADDDDGY